SARALARRWCVSSPAPSDCRLAAGKMSGPVRRGSPVRSCFYGGRVGTLREERGVLPSFCTGARKNDHVMGNDPDMNQLLDAAGAQCGPGHLPKGPPVVTK